MNNSLGVKTLFRRSIVLLEKSFALLDRSEKNQFIFKLSNT